jgi:hypothetical protein
MLSGGEITHLGDPAKVGRAYLSENFAGPASGRPTAGAGDAISVVGAWVADGTGNRVDAIGHGEVMQLHAVLESSAAISEPGIAIWLTNQDGVRVFAAGAREDGAALSDLEPGERLEFAIELTNPLSAGRYFLGCSVTRGSAGLDTLLYVNRAADVVSFGADLHGLVAIDYVPTVTRTRTAETVR